MKIHKSIVLIFAIKKTRDSREFSRIFLNSCFKEHPRTAASGETVVTVFCSTDAVARKY